MTLLPLLFWFLIPLTKAASDWSGISQCGQYQVSGIARSTKKGPVIVVNENSQSEFRITVPLTNEARIVPYLDKALIATVSFEKQPVDYHYQGVVIEIGSRIPNPLSPKDSGVKMLSGAKCKK